MQIGEQDLARGELAALGELRLLDLDHQIRGGEDLGRRCGDLGAGRLVMRVFEADASPGARLNQHLMASIHQFAHTRGDQTHPILMNLDLFGDADLHGELREW